MKKIPLTHGKFALVDDEDFDFLNQWKWHLSDGGYAQRNNLTRIGVGKYKNRMLKMHRVVNETPDKLFTDHINRNKLDNRKCNLRNATKSLNGINRGKPSNNVSGFKGVHVDGMSWRAEIAINGKRIKLGRFKKLEDAVSARLKAEKKYHAI